MLKSGVEVQEQAKAGTAPPSSNKKWLWIGIVAFVVIAAASITTGVVVSNKNKSDKSTSNQESNGGGGSVVTDGEPTSLTFAQSKSSIDLLCGDDTSFEDCQTECENVPDCCKPDGECLNDDLNGCIKYAKCHVVKKLEEPAPTNLEDLCAGTVGDMTECESACSNVTCCYKDEEECESPFYFLTCLDYAPCQNLRDGATIETAPDGLDDTCNPLGDEGVADRDQCDATCKKASCCWSMDPDENNENCLENDFIACLTHAPCGLLAIPEANNKVPAPEDLLNNTCELDKIWEAGSDRDACQAVCDDAACCGNLNMTNGGMDNCFLQDPFGCAEYAPCALLPLTGGDVVRAPTNLMETCDWQNFSDPATEQDCERECEKARCCWDTTDENCLTKGNLLTCIEYAPCAILILSGGDVPEPEDGALDDCSRESVESDAAQCKSICGDGRAGCCFDVDLESNCYINNLDTCTQWLVGGCMRIALNEIGV